MKILLFLCCLLVLITAYDAFHSCKEMGQLHVGISKADVIKIMD